MRTVATLAFLIVAVLLLPLWVQLVLFFCALFVLRQKLLLFIPAVFSDVLYAPTGSFSFFAIKMTLVVAGILILHWIVFTKTRVGQLFYGVET